MEVNFRFCEKICLLIVRFVKNEICTILLILYHDFCIPFLRNFQFSINYRNFQFAINYRNFRKLLNTDFENLLAHLHLRKTRNLCLKMLNASKKWACKISSFRATISPFRSYKWVGTRNFENWKQNLLLALHFNHSHVERKGEFN